MARRKHKLWKLLPITRAIGVLSAVGITTTLVTFAALQSNGSALTGNTIQTATAALQISKDGATFADTLPGFDFTDLVPGGAAQPTHVSYMLYAKNVGTTTLSLSLTVSKAPAVSGTVDLSKVSVLLTPVGGTAQSFPLSTLLAGSVPIANSSLPVNTVLGYHVQVQMAADAVSGNSASITGLDLSVSGTPQ